MFKAVIFDIDGTIYSYVTNDKIAVESLCKFAEKNLNVAEKDFRAVYKEARRIVKEERLTDGGARHSRVLFWAKIRFATCWKCTIFTGITFWRICNRSTARQNLLKNCIARASKLRSVPI